MSDDNDETINAGPEVLRAVQEELAARQARAAQALDQGADAIVPDATESGDLSVPVWRPVEADDDDLTVARVDLDAIEAVDVVPDEADDDDLTVAPVDLDASEPRAPEARALEPVVLAPVNASSDPSPARDFVREVRERAEATEQQGASVDTKQRRSGLWVVLSIVFGAQIIAGGLYLALTALGDDSEEFPATEEVVAGAEATEPQAPPIIDPGTNPTPTPAPTPVGTPTPVPPTPSWVPVADGPRSAPFTYVVEAIVNTPRVFDGRDGDQLDLALDGRSIPLVNPLPSGEPLVLRVVGGQPGDEWIQVELPGEALVAWVQAEEFVWDSTTVLVQVDLFTNTLRVFDGNTSVYAASIASGTPGRPTPQLSTYVFEDAAVNGEPTRMRLAHFGARRALSDGLSALVIEATSDSDLFETDGGYVTDGRILLAPDDFAQVRQLVRVGAKVEIVGVPAAPTPTPLPDARDNAADPSQGGFFGCPPATRGAPPNCYRLVDRLTSQGECAGLQVLFEGDCYLLGGNPEFDAFGLNCQQNAPTEIGGLCYLKMGPVPQLPGACPEGARDVDGECRMPV